MDRVLSQENRRESCRGLDVGGERIPRKGEAIALIIKKVLLEERGGSTSTARRKCIVHGRRVATILQEGRGVSYRSEGS